MPIHIITAAIFVFMAYKWGDIKNWKSYYNTILFFCAGDLMYNFLFKDKLLWQWKSPFLGDAAIELLWLVVLFPCIILLYIPYISKKKGIMAKLFHIFLWVIAFSVLEWIFYRFGYIAYFNGWTFLCSVIFYSLMFPLLEIHHINPLLAILASFIGAAVTILIFRVPIKI